MASNSRKLRSEKFKEPRRFLMYSRTSADISVAIFEFIRGPKTGQLVSFTRDQLLHQFHNLRREDRPREETLKALMGEWK